MKSPIRERFKALTSIILRLGQAWNFFLLLDHLIA
jgi:hypothetical protein